MFSENVLVFFTSHHSSLKCSANSSCYHCPLASINTERTGIEKDKLNEYNAPGLEGGYKTHNIVLSRGV